jgi:hypothetical protein
MPKLSVQTSLYDAYNDVSLAMENDKPEFLKALKEHIYLQKLIPNKFYTSFYRLFGRPRTYKLESFIWFFILQKVLGIVCDSTMLVILRICKELREFCGFDKVPDASKITRFRQDFVEYINLLFDNLVEVTEPICRAIDTKKADYLIYDLTGILAYVTENNPKFLNTILNQTKKLAKKNPDLNPYALAYSSLPDVAKANPFVNHQYINGHFCYAHKIGILTNGLGIVRDIAFFDDKFKKDHPEVVSKKTDNPEHDKEIGDSISLKPVLSDFFAAHPTFSYKTFLGDSSFDSYDAYTMLRNEFHFDRMVIPLNNRNSSTAHSDFDENGVPICPLDKTPFTFLGNSGGKNRSRRLKWVCHKSEKVPKSSDRICTCDTPCTDSSYGRCVYTYPDKDLRLCPGIARGTKHWNNLYRYRVLIERTINIFKDPLGVASRKSLSQRTAKADVLFAGITHLIGVVLAFVMNKLKYFKSIRKLIE